MNTSNLVFNSMANIEEAYKENIPDGYIEVKLSTKGKLGAPECFHIRNFKVKDIISLSLTFDSDLPKRLIDILNGMIYEDNIDVGDFHEKEVEELMVKIYMSFFKNNIDLIFPYTEKDVQFVKENLGEKLANSLINKEWKPTCPITLSKDLSTYEIPDDFNPNITITNKKTGFHVTFGYMKYKDRLIVKKWLDDLYSEEEIKFKKIKDIISFNNELTLKGEFDKLIPVNPSEEEEYKDYINEKFQTLTEASRLISILDCNGKDVSKMNLSEKYRTLSNEAQIDYGMISKLARRQALTPFGIKPEVSMKNPFTGESCERRVSFRIPVILQAIQVSGDSEYDDGYDDAHRDNVE